MTLSIKKKILLNSQFHNNEAKDKNKRNDIKRVQLIKIIIVITIVLKGNIPELNKSKCPLHDLIKMPST